MAITESASFIFISPPSLLRSRHGTSSRFPVQLPEYENICGFCELTNTRQQVIARIKLLLERKPVFRCPTLLRVFHVSRKFTHVHLIFAHEFRSRLGKSWTIKPAMITGIATNQNPQCIAKAAPPKMPPTKPINSPSSFIRSSLPSLLHGSTWAYRPLACLANHASSILVLNSAISSSLIPSWQLNGCPTVCGQHLSDSKCRQALLGQSGTLQFGQSPSAAA